MAGFYHGVRLLDDKHQEIDLIQTAEGCIRVSSEPFGWCIAAQEMADYSTWSKVGYNGEIGTTEEIVSPQGGTYVFPTAETQLYAIGDSAQDRVGGTGINSLTVYYLDDDYVEKSDTVSLNAASVALGVSDVYRIQNVRSKTVGTNYKAVGNIKIANAGGTVTYGYIAAGQNRQRQAVWTVPASHTLYVTTFNRSAISATATKYCTISLKANYDDKLGLALTPGLFFMSFAETSLESSVSNVEYIVPMKFIEKTDIIVTGIASSGTAAVHMALRGWIEHD